jgi:hypothetical protein
MLPLQIEHRKPEWQKARRGSVPPGVRAMFHEFAEGNQEWDRGVEWIEDRAPLWWGRNVPGWVVALPFIALAAACFFLIKCAG